MGPPGLVLYWLCSRKISRVVGFFRSNIKPHAWEAPLFYPSVASTVKDIKDVFIMFVGTSLPMEVIYTECLIFSRVRVRSKTRWQEKLGRT